MVILLWYCRSRGGRTVATSKHESAARAKCCWLRSAGGNLRLQRRCLLACFSSRGTNGDFGIAEPKPKPRHGNSDENWPGRQPVFLRKRRGRIRYRERAVENSGASSRYATGGSGSMSWAGSTGTATIATRIRQTSPILRTFSDLAARFLSIFRPRGGQATHSA